MTMHESRSLSVWIARHTFFVWLGILLNMIFVIGLLFYPHAILAFFNIPISGSTVWARLSGLLLGIVSIFYIPPTIDLERFRVYAWMAIFPSRSFGATFCFLAVFVFDQPAGLIAGILLDGLVGLVTLICLIKVTKLEAARRSAGTEIGDLK